MRDYQFVSPSLDGILRHESIVYEGLNRPSDLIRAFDSPARTKDDRRPSDHDHKVLSQYFQDLHSIYLKKLSCFVIDSSVGKEEGLKLQAMLQELVKIKGLISGPGETIES